MIWIVGFMVALTFLVLCVMADEVVDKLRMIRMSVERRGGREESLDRMESVVWDLIQRQEGAVHWPKARRMVYDYGRKSRIKRRCHV